jgi:Pyridoxamine 5'-phosphate oxidase
MVATANRTRTQAAEAYVKALRTGEPSATTLAGQALAEEVVLKTANEEIGGRDKVLARITGQWPLTPVYVQGFWGAPRESGDQVTVTAEFGPLGAAPARVALTFSFNQADQIARVEQQNTMAPPLPQSDRLPDVVRGLINGALANGTPICVSYVDENGQPSMSLRGSTQIFSDTQLCIWVRNADGGIIKAMQRNPRLGLLYRDSKTRSTLIMQGRGHVETDEAVRERVFTLAPEVEQNHDPGRRGAALIIDITSLQGTTVRGPVKFTASLSS